MNYKDFKNLEFTQNIKAGDTVAGIKLYERENNMYYSMKELIKQGIQFDEDENIESLQSIKQNNKEWVAEYLRLSK